MFHSSVSWVQVLKCKLLMSHLHGSTWKSLSQEANEFPDHAYVKLQNRGTMCWNYFSPFFEIKQWCRLWEGVLHHLLVSKEKLVRFCFLKLIPHLDPRQRSWRCHLNDFWKCLTVLPDSYYICQQKTFMNFMQNLKENAYKPENIHAIHIQTWRA